LLEEPEVSQVDIAIDIDVTGNRASQQRSRGRARDIALHDLPIINVYITISVKIGAGIH